MAKTIMVVDDEPDNRSTVKTVLEKNGYEVETAINADDALKKAKKTKFDLILMDISLPVMDGYDATRNIRKSFQSIPIIGLSAHAMSGDDERAKAAGCNDYLTKPVDEDRLLKMLKEYLGVDNV